jgi:CHAP domain
MAKKTIAQLVTAAVVGTVTLGTMLVATTAANASTTRDSIAARAKAEITSGHTTELPAGSNCNFYTGALRFHSSNCASGYGQSAWCADFAKYVWKTAGVTDYLSDLDGWAQSFKTYGTNHGTYHSRSSGYVPQPGDAVMFDWDGDPSDAHPIDHVGLVTSAANGRVYLISGNNSSDTVGTSNYPLSSGYIVGYTTPVGLITNTPTSYADGAVLREPDGTIELMVGGMPYYLSPADYAELGTPPATSVPAGTFAMMPSEIRDGVIVRKPNGDIYEVVGNFGYHLSPADYAQIGSPSWVSVPSSLIGTLSAAPDDDTVLRDVSSGAEYQIIGGARYWITATDAVNLGNPSSTNVPTGFVNSITRTVPAGSLFLRNPVDGAIYQVVNGAKFWLTPAEWAALDKSEAINTPAGFINTLGAMPADYTYLRNVVDGAIYQIVAGTKYHLSPAEFASLGSPNATNTVPEFLNTIPTRTTL